MRAALGWFGFVVLVIGLRAMAGEAFIGSIVTPADGGWANNVSPQDGGGFDGGAFWITPRSLVTVQCSSAAYVCVNSEGCSGSAIGANALTGAGGIGRGVKLAADTAFPTSVGNAIVLPGLLLADAGCSGRCITLQDGGTYPATTSSALVSVVPVSASGGSISCPVWVRTGNEF